MSYDPNPLPDLDSVRRIFEAHDEVEPNVLSLGGSETLSKVRLDQYRTLLRDLNRKAEEVLRYQANIEWLAATEKGGLDAEINSLLNP